jgi:hypothetical protein
MESVERDRLESANGIRLSGRQWAGLGLFMLALYLLVPRFWPRLERVEPGADYRVPYDLSQDYWHFERVARVAAARADTLVVGDSVVWGQYVRRDQTLPHYLNVQAGGERFANLGLDGAHPLALAGLLEHYGGGLEGKNVLLHCNPMWLMSPEADLRVWKEGLRVNHPALLPQLDGAVAAYREDGSRRLGAFVEQRVAFHAWTRHLQAAYYGQTSMPAWTLERPYENPFGAVTLKVPPPDDGLRHEPVSWVERKIPKQDFAWVDLATSLQWRAFRRAVEVLERRGNRVVVLVGPFNEHLLTEKGREGYLRVKSGIEAWLRDRKVPFVAPEVLPSDQYADASHPLAEGYALLARRVFESDAWKVALAERTP